MSDPVRDPARAVIATCAALPMAAALTLILSRWLPISFEYRENDLGIVSVASENHYPIAQETFWLAFGLVVGASLVWSIARALARFECSPRLAIAVEATSIAAFASVLALPQGIAELAVVACGFGLWALAGRGAATDGPQPGAAQPPEVRSRAANALWAVSIALVSVVLTRGIWLHLWTVHHDIGDYAIAVDNFKFLGESGQHLAWANALRHGWFQGRDVFCLYGPLYDLGLVGFWALVGKSVAAWNLYWSLTRVLGWISLFALGGALVKNRAALIALPFLLPWIELRVGWAMFAAWFLLRWLVTDRHSWLIGAGVLSGIGLLYSQEYGTAIAIVALTAFAIRRDPRATFVYALSAASIVSPLLVYYAVHGALIPMLSDVVQYPAYMIAGYGKLIFPAITANLPLDLAEFGSGASHAMRLAYAVPVVCLGAFLLLLPVSSLDARRPLRSLREIADALARDPQRLMMLLIAIFGMIAFRSAMGRASLHRTHAALPAVALLVCFAFDRALAVARERRLAAGWRIATLALFVAVAGFWQSASPLTDSWRSIRYGAQLLRIGFKPRGDANILRVARWIQSNTEANEPVLFLPNDGAYYYLTDRPNPIRFVMGHQMVGRAHRDEALADLTARPPRFVVWDHHALRVDDLPEEKVIGRAILAFIEQNYALEHQIDQIDILRHRTLEQPDLIADW